MVCCRCGNILRDGDKFCGNCSWPTDRSYSETLPILPSEQTEMQSLCSAPVKSKRDYLKTENTASVRKRSKIQWILFWVHVAGLAGLFYYDAIRFPIVMDVPRGDSSAQTLINNYYLENAIDIIIVAAVGFIACNAKSTVASCCYVVLSMSRVRLFTIMIDLGGRLSLLLRILLRTIIPIAILIINILFQRAYNRYRRWRATDIEQL